MRALLFLVVTCIVAGPASAANELADCAGIDSAVERLDCYDRLARDKANEEQLDEQQSKARRPGETATGETDPPKRTPERPAQAEPEKAEPARKPAPAKSLAEERSKSNRRADTNDEPMPEDKLEWFGKNKPENPAAEVSHMDARIESVRKTPSGQHVMTLSNGQVWMENEPGRRRVEPDQDVTIRKHRWHFEMELDNRPDVAVRRVK